MLRPLEKLGSGESQVVYNNRVIFGEVLNDSVAALQDVNLREFLILTTLALMVIALGVWPVPLVEYLQPSLEKILNLALLTKVS